MTDALTMSQASIDTLDNYVGPVREEFDELKRKIDEKSTEFDELETEYYSQVTRV
jgi:peptidoglycan hydrolase CwlO-like protein